MSLYFPLDDAVRKARRLEVALPAEVAAGYDRLVELATRLEEFKASGLAAPVTSELNAAFAEAFEAGDDPLAAGAVAGLLGRGHAGTDLAGALEAQAKRFLGQHAEAIFASFGPVFDRAANALVEVHGRTGSVNLKHLPRDAPRVERAEVALTTVNDIVLVWKQFAFVPETPFRYDRTRGVLVIADVPPEIWWRTRPDTAGVSGAWDALCAGLTLCLATPATYRQRCRAIDDARDDVLRKIERESQPARPELRSKPTISVL